MKILKKITALILMISLVGIFAPEVLAAGTLTEVSDQLSRLKVSEKANHYVKFKTGTTGTIKDYKIEFPDAFDLSSATTTSPEIKVGGVDRSADGNWTFSNATGTKYAKWTYTTATSVSASTQIELWFNTVGNPANSGSYLLNVKTLDDSGNNIDVGETTVYIVSDDQVAVSGKVAETLSFSLSTNATNFGTFDLGTVNTSVPNVTSTISTNAASGASVYIQDQGNGTNPGLYKSVSPTHLIASASTTLSAGNEGYGIQATTTANGSGATITIASAYDKSGNDVGGLNITPTLLGSASAPIFQREIVVTHKAAISNLTPAGNYSDVLTYSCAGNF